MAVMEILRWPDPTLKTAAETVEQGTELGALLADMFDTMYDAPGRGLAAPQVGVLKRVFVMDCTWKDGPRSPLACVNPQILWRSDEIATHEEGCLSIPGVVASLPRPARVRMRWHDADWALHEAELSGFEAVCAQHEFDHLEGRVYLDYLSPDHRAEVLRAYEEAGA